MAKTGVGGIKRIINATRYSFQGLSAAIRHEAAFRQELLLMVILLPAAIYLGNDNIERAMMIASLFIVLIAELLNSAIEALVDRVGDEHHVLSGRAKDIGSAAVFLSLVNVAVVWLIIIFF